MKIKRRLSRAGTPFSFALISLLSFLDAVASVFLIYPNSFAPVGIIGIGAMIQHALGVSAGYTFLLVNAPMLAIAFFALDKLYSLKNACYIIVFSVGTVALQLTLPLMDIAPEELCATSAAAAMLIAAFYGAFMGMTYSFTVLLGGSTGGSDILAALIHRALPRFNTVWVLFAINSSVAVASYFVYGRRLLPVALSVSCALVTGALSHRLLNR